MTFAVDWALNNNDLSIYPDIGLTETAEWSINTADLPSNHTQ